METQAQARVMGIAWRLLAPSDSGGKVYSIAVVGNELVVAWGRRTAAGPTGAGSQVKAERYSSHAAALTAAMDRTVAKQERDYGMDIPPRQLDVTGRSVVGLNTLGLILRHGTVV